MLTNFIPDKIYVICGRSDLRMGIDGLSGIIEHEFGLNIYDKSLFMFCGVRNDRIKAIYWNENGIVLLYKRLESGNRFKWPKDVREAKLLTPQQYRWLMEGLSIEQPKANKPVDTSSLHFT